ncbi:MAG: hypothetical protein V2J02_11415 [Pseudomonadales bacterium]|nr:hypothetical protein [Pseudomonadales bacterium]
MTDRSSFAMRIALCSLLFPTAAQVHAEDWNWSLTPYGWAIGAEVDTGARFGGAEPIEQDFSDLVDKLDFAAQLHLEVQKDRIGFLLDVTTLSLSDEVTRGPLQIETDSSTTLIEGAVLLGAFERGVGTQVMAGFRSVNLDLDLEIQGLGPIGGNRQASADATLYDAMVGVRHGFALGENWSLTLRGDVATGDTDFTWNAAAIAGRSFGDKGALLFGYRYMSVQLDAEGDLLDPELTLYGPVAGYMFRF